MGVLSRMIRSSIRSKGYRWAMLPGMGFPASSRGIEWQDVADRHVNVSVDPAAFQILDQIRADRGRENTGMPTASVLAWFKPGMSPAVEVYCSDHYIGTARDEELHRVVMANFDPRHPKWCHTGARLWPDQRFVVDFQVTKSKQG